MIHIDKIESSLYRAPLENPVRTSFGVMLSRPMLLVRLTDQDGAQGIGEVWCNFPSFGGEARAHMLVNEIAPLLTSRAFVTPAQATSFLIEQTRVLSVQTGEAGPLHQCIAGVDLALHDLCARKKGQSLQAHLGETEADFVPVYASGINPDGAAQTVTRFANLGYEHFKLKVGFGRDKDLKNVDACLSKLPAGGTLAVDANQGWDASQAQAMLNELNAFDLAWIEEPIIATAPTAAWEKIGKTSRHLIAGGENITGLEAFRRAVDADVLDIFQPDVAKWGGLSLCHQVAELALAAGKLYYPHYLGGGVGLLASAHLLAAVGGVGRLEVDVNPNPLRENLLGDRLRDPKAGLSLAGCLGVGVDPALEAIAEFETLHLCNRSG